MPNDVTHNEAESRYELDAGGAEPAVAAYREEGDVIVFTHTVVAEELEGQGIATRLIAGALEDVRRRGRKVRPLCEFVAHYIERHPDAQDLLES